MFRTIRSLLIVFGCMIGGEVMSAPDEVRIAGLIRSGELQEAYNELQSSDPRLEDILFFRGLIAQSNEDYPQAISLFSEALVENPNHLNARRELASTLLLQGSYSRAERAFLELIDLDNSQGMDRIYEGYIRQIRERNPIAVSGHISILPSTNVNRGTENLIFDSSIGDFVIDPNSQARSGVGLQAGLSGYFRIYPEGDNRNTLSWGLVGNLYQESDFNTATASLRFTHSRRLNDLTRISFGAYSRYTWRADDAGNSAVGVSLDLQHALSPRDILTFGLLHEQREYFRQPHNTGPFSQLSFRFIHQHSPSLSYNFGVTASRRETNATHVAYHGLEIRSGLNRAWAGGLTTGFSLSAGLRDYDTDFPLAGEPRGDEFYGVTISLQNDNWNFRGFVPRVSCSYTHNNSNIGFYEYDVSECNLSITRRF